MCEICDHWHIFSERRRCRRFSHLTGLSHIDNSRGIQWEEMKWQCWIIHVYNISHSSSTMGWLKSFPYKWQVAEITLGLSTLVCGAVFFLISRGVTSPLWIILAGTFLCIGVVCTLMGASWCCWSLQRIQTDHEVYGKIKDCEIETLTSAMADNNR